MYDRPPNPHNSRSRASKADPNKNREKNKMFSVPDTGLYAISKETKRDASLVLSGTSIRLKRTPVDLLTALRALDLVEETSQEEVL